MTRTWGLLVLSVELTRVSSRIVFLLVRNFCRNSTKYVHSRDLPDVLTPSHYLSRLHPVVRHPRPPQTGVEGPPGPGRAYGMCVA